MLNYSIMSLDEEHIDQFCADIEYQVKNKIATMPLFCMTLTPEGNPAIDKADLLCAVYEKYKAKLDAAGIPSGALIQASMGHGWKLNQPSAFQKYTNLTDGVTPEVCCPLDKGFRRYIRNSAKRIAQTRPDHIMLDDDFRLLLRNGKGCACPLHMAEFNRQAGTSLTREELYTAICKKDGEASRYKEIFIKTQVDSLIDCAKEIRAGIDEVDPKIHGSYCMCRNEGAYEIAEIMAGEGNPVTLRINNAVYCQSDRRFLTTLMQRMALETASLTKMPDVLLAETDTCPQNRYSTSAATLHSHFSLSILQGAMGAKHWITRLSVYEPKSGSAYRKKLEKYSGFYEELAKISEGVEWMGCRQSLPTTPFFPFTPDVTEPQNDNGWGAHVLDRMGLPIYFEGGCDGTGACFFDRKRDAGFSNDELLEFFKGNVVLDAPAAMRFIERGFGKYLGVDVKPYPESARPASGELLGAASSSKALPHLHELIPLSKNVKIYSEVYHLRDGVYKDILFPGVTSYKNELGGTTVVFSGSANFNHSLVHAFGWLNESRKRQIVNILNDLGELPVYYPDDAEVLLKAGKTKDGKLLCAAVDVSLDPIEEFPFVTDFEVKSVKRLCPDGSYEELSFTKNGNHYTTSATANVFDPLVLIIESKPPVQPVGCTAPRRGKYRLNP